MRGLGKRMAQLIIKMKEVARQKAKEKQSKE
ncbi:MAG: hypothetical protein BWY78_00948 [Alphaproteobacteria bacterium ADurb.Bin438]|nr:MAG: hypothetical protein BWY78_00948 [Alphaproteobacteria bacterium ADurb.Bin438]